MDKSNPANEAGPVVTDDTRVSMALPQLMLEVPEIEGHVMHWFADRPGRIPRALKAGYQFVTPDEISLNNFGVASSLTESGNTDLGTRVSVHGGTGENGGSERLYLMKIRKEWYDKDMKLREEASDKVVEALRGGAIGSDRDSSKDALARYVKKSADNLFTKNKAIRPRS